ncbi:MAG: class I SAM-dependent methyltransferase [Candidatus Omnitrophota bacterium]|jgi:SAM-dependent methyltransferase
MLKKNVFNIMSQCLVCQSYNIQEFARGWDFEYLTSLQNYSIRRCQDCGLLFLSPRPHKEDSEKLYNANYYTVNRSSPLFLRGFIYQTKLKNDIRKAAFLINRYHCNSVLEIGCGNVLKLVGLRKVFGNRELRLIGVDIQFSKETQELARSYNIELYQGDADFVENNFNLSQIHLVLMSQVLEHLENPVRFLKIIEQLMAPSAKLLIETPSPSGIDFLLFRRRFWGGFHIPRHFYIFSQLSLVNLLKKNNFIILKKDFMPSPGFWIMSFRNALGLNSIRRSDSKWEFLSFHNIFVVMLFTAIDILCRVFFLPTSNQSILSETTCRKAVSFTDQNEN